MKKKTLDLLRSGNFTLAWHDRDCCTIHKGKMSYDKLPQDEDGDLIDVIETVGGASEGYSTQEVDLLVAALGGKVVSV